MTVPRLSVLETVLQRDRAIVLAGIGGITALSWGYLAYLAWDMGQMDMQMAMPRMVTWSAVDLFLLFVMWAVMMVAMMVPSATPLVLLFASTNRRRMERTDPFVPTGIFLLGYVLVWAGYSAVATLVQWGLHSAALLSPMMVSVSPVFGGSLLIAAGVFQWTPLKQSCLVYCRSPLGFLTTQWREGSGGALLMGLRHGVYCVGCCWILMALLFVAGVMNLFWVASITAFVLIEKLVPRGVPIGLMAGGALIVAGVGMLIQA